MGLGHFLRRRAVVMGMAAGLAVGAAAQTSITLTEPPAPLLPQSFGQWKMAGNGPGAPAGAMSLSSVNKAALEECGPQRSQVADYGRGGRTLHVEAIQFGDKTGAVSAFTLVERPGMQQGTDLGAADAVGDGAVLFTVGDSVVLVSGGAADDVVGLKPLAQAMPKVFGSKGVVPLLPSLAPVKGMVSGSLRYALGPETYAAEGGVLPANSLGWGKSAEGVTAQYSDRHGKETLTLVLYPTPQIAISLTRAIQGEVAQMGPSFASARVRREGALVMLANGSFSGDEAQKMVDNVHLRQEVSFDKSLGLGLHSQVGQTYSLLANIALLSGVMMAAAVLLGLFLGGGRALFRVMRGKPAAVEAEFLSLHLAPQNKAPQFGAPDTGDRS
jgi:drug/metabolite transporter superfamily protein YnfA